jgi:hypothetical protein
MKAYEVYMEGYVDNGGRGAAHYVGVGEGETFADAAYDACVKAYGKDETDKFFTKYNDNEVAYWGCRMYDNYDDAAKFVG